MPLGGLHWPVNEFAFPLHAERTTALASANPAVVTRMNIRSSQRAGSRPAISASAFDIEPLAFAGTSAVG
jgi:hypothetical protein